MINYSRTSKILLVALIVLSPLYYLAFAGDQSKSNEFFVGTSTSSINSATDFPFSFYIGDNLQGVTNPLKSAFFSVSGVYTGGGTIQFKIDSDALTAKTFTLPSVSKPTDFSLIYYDDSLKINPSTAGNYNYTLNVIPSGITISGFGAKLQTTHQFAPTSCVDGPATNQKIKTSEFLVASLNNPINSSAVLPFSIYIGDDLSGITNPIKSFYFSVSGVYTGGGNLGFNIGDDGLGTSTNFTLPSVSDPTNFNFIYNDEYNQINPTSAGTYNYKLNLSLSGPTISNLSIKAIMNHRYKPSGCGSSYPAYGDLISTVYDSTSNTDGAAYNSIMWKGALGGASFDQGKVKFQLAASDNPAGPWNYYGGTTCGSNDWYEILPGIATELSCNTQFNNKRYFRYKIRLCSTDCLAGGATTPQVDDVIVNWSP